MTKGRIWADSTPSQNGSAIDNQITHTDEPMTQGGEHAEHEGAREAGNGDAPSAPPDDTT